MIVVFFLWRYDAPAILGSNCINMEIQRKLKLNKTIKTSTKVLSNTVLAAALMMGNVNVQTSQDYYEDKEGFHQVSTSMENGWGWSLGFNKANANTCSNNLITNCEAGEGEDTTEHIPVVGQRPPTEPWQGVPDESTEDYGSTGGGGGGGPSEPPSPSPEELKKERIRQCKADALKVNKDEYSNIEGVMQATIVGCSFLKFKTAVSTCTGAAIWAAADARNQSDIRYAAAVDECDKL
ncbi:hypothetical protein SG34_002650 [Thalassomonas viridans]|uniref:Uncharacterized protein n=1 Tax=Thalassomonas viridans TaxID=137584 RepID=A0AAE9Z3F8_9GAMM|nr:hypothetical protein [Thalassomonas viridans]WDE05853.1 hypothetical protein SG34_002650 [Thalassomonas viridans]